MNSEADNPIKVARRGIMLVLSSPSGAGKSTIARTLLEKNRNLELSVSVTTRTQRPSEIDGTHYHFISRGDFERRRDSDALLEYAEVHGNFYGTPREPVEKALEAGKDVLFDIDYQGGQQLFEKARADVVSIFILPPSMEELKARLVRRAEDAPETIANRLENAVQEIPHWREYDYVVVNDNLQRAFNAVQSILLTESLKRDRNHGLYDFERYLLG